MQKIIPILIISFISTASISSEWFSSENVSQEFKLGLSEKISQLDPARRENFKNKLKSLSKQEQQNLINEFRQWKSNYRERKNSSRNINNNDAERKRLMKKVGPMSQERKEAIMKRVRSMSPAQKDAFRKKKNSMSQSQRNSVGAKMRSMSQSQRNSIANKRRSMSPSQKDAFKKKMRSMSPAQKKALRKKMRGSMR
jgi:hypothetical protein